MATPICKLGSDDLLSEVLIRLRGPKSAFRCKPVCKRWNSLISTPYFSRRFVSHHRTLSATDEPNPPVLTHSQVYESILSFVPFPHESTSTFSILDASKDLLLLGFWGLSNSLELRRTHLVCNSVTKQWVALPLAPETSARDSRFNWIVKLVWEPFSFHGQGDDDLGKGEGEVRFRVVRMYNPATSTASQIDVYVFCSGSGGWTKSILRLDSDLRCNYYPRVVLVNEKLCWLNRRKQVVVWDPFSAERLPNLIEHSKIGSYFDGPWVSEGALYMSWEQSSGISIWRLEEKRGWSKQYEIMSLKNLRCSGVILHTCEIEASERMSLLMIGVHPTKSEIVFFRAFLCCCRRTAYLSWDFSKKELELFNYEDEESRQPVAFLDDQMFQPKVTLWPSLLPSNEKMRNTYNGSYNCWLPPSSQSS